MICDDIYIVFNLEFRCPSMDSSKKYVLKTKCNTPFKSNLECFRPIMYKQQIDLVQDNVYF